MSVLRILGTKEAPARAEGPVELLLGCHARIRDFTDLAARLASDEPASEADVADAARRVHRYHAVALPLHQADEELSIAPRLEPVASDPLLRALSEMRRQHVELDETLGSLLRLWERLAAEPGRRAEMAKAMLRGVTRMRGLWAQHLSLEEELVFPELDRVLSPAQLASIAAEMRARRSPR